MDDTWVNFTTENLTQLTLQGNGSSLSMPLAHVVWANL
jgi:hypothetical protein